MTTYVATVMAQCIMRSLSWLAPSSYYSYWTLLHHTPMDSGPPNIDKPASETPKTPEMRNDSFEVNMPSGDVDLTGRKTRGSIASDSSEDPLDSLVGSPTLPFLAYGRRRSSFISPFQINKARYLLSFADAETAQEWWTLMQSEYPDTLRESPNLFSFKSDRTPIKAWGNPKFAHLSDKWSYRQTDGKDDKVTHQQPIASHRRISSARTPLMPTVSEGHVFGALERLDRLEDPFTPAGANNTEFAQLNLASDHIQKSVSQSTLQLDALLEGQQASARGFQKLSTTIERMTQQMEALARRQQDHEIVLRELTAAATANNAASDVQYRHQQAAALQSLQSVIEETCSRVQELYLKPPPTPGPNHEILHELQEEVSQTSTLLRDLYNRPLPESDGAAQTESIQKLQRQLLQNTKAIRALSDRPEPIPNTETLQKLQKEASQTTAILRGITDRLAAAANTPPAPVSAPNTELLQQLQKDMTTSTTLLQALSSEQRTTKKHLSTLHSTLDTTTLTQKALATQLKQTHTLAQNTQTSLFHLTSAQETRFAALEAKMDRQTQQMKKTMTVQFEKQQEAFKGQLDEILGAVNGRNVVRSAECGHGEVLPPPKKIGRKIVGYVYEKE
ncbi:hypothetical protein M436DRAFT_35396 [Aureobasidium namibiae CBS 147.97]|uniref:Uncharacterized protein n=1 Tax=Aureobasidium namibiae CBS 147.97 TaxID=1043004 RepID=A0A074X7K4_9PEZI